MINIINGNSKNMEPIILLSLILVGLLAGVVGSLFGIGGGIFIVPILTIVYHLDASTAIPVSLVAIVATSVGGTVFYLDKKVTNVRLGILFEITTALGAVIGALMAGFAQEWILLGLFSVVLVLSSVKMILDKKKETICNPDGEHSYVDLKTGETYRYDVKNVKSGMCGFVLAGILSSMTGVGGGVIKVPIMNLHMNIPIKAATATSNYMVGITAFSGAIMYFIAGTVDLEIAAFVAIGTFAGAMIGSKLSGKIDTQSLKKYFAILILAIAALTVLRAGGIL